MQGRRKERDEALPGSYTRTLKRSLRARFPPREQRKTEDVAERTETRRARWDAHGVLLRGGGEDKLLLSALLLLFDPSHSSLRRSEFSPPPPPCWCRGPGLLLLLRDSAHSHVAGVCQQHLDGKHTHDAPDQSARSQDLNATGTSGSSGISSCPPPQGHCGQSRS